MSTDSIRSELVSLVSDSREQFAFFEELGVELVEARSGTQEAPLPLVQKSAPPLTPHHDEVASSQSKLSSVNASALFEDLAASPATLSKSSETFEQIHAEIGDCTRCPLYEGRTNVVHTEGNRKARLMFVGEAPGADEDLQARPFVGRAGQLLTKIIEAIGFKRDEVLIGNVNRCRPPGNRAPTAEEAAMCKPYLLREIAAAQPEVIVVLGNTATSNLLDTRERISRLRGLFQDYRGIPVMPTFHPAYLLRDGTKKRETWEDMKRVREYLDRKQKETGAD